MNLSKLVTFLLLTASMSWADVVQVQKLLETALRDSPGKVIPEQLFPALADMNDLPVADVQLILPLAAKCIRSHNLDVRREGVIVFQAVAMRSDSAKLLDVYIDDLGAVLRTPADPLKQGVLYALAITKPAMSPKAIALFTTLFDDKTTLPEDVAGIAGTLIKASPTDKAMIHKVVSFAEQKPDVHVTITVVNALGLSRTHNPEALDFIGKSLDNENRDVREQTIQAVGHLDRDVRVGFVAKHAAQFGRLAADPEIRSESRRQAADALSNREMVR